VVLEHLVKAGHAVKAVTYDRGRVRNLGADFDLFETAGLHIGSANNRVSPLKTLLANLQQLPDGHKRLNALRLNCSNAAVGEFLRRHSRLAWKGEHGEDRLED
jgi:hypothetical protein